MATRAFGPNVDRIVRQTTIVYSADDIRRNITLRLDDGAPCNLEMGADITIEKPLTVSGALSSFSLSGATRFTLTVAGTMASVFSFGGFDLTDEGCPVDIYDITIQAKAGASVVDVFAIDQAATLLGLHRSTAMFSRVSVDFRLGTAVNVFGGVSATLARVVVERLSVRGVQNLLGEHAGTRLWQWCHISDSLLINDDAGLTLLTIGLGAAVLTLQIQSSSFEGLYGAFDVDLNATAVDNLWHAIDGGNAGGGFVSVGQRNTLLRVAGFAPRTISGTDIDLDVAGGGGGGVTPTAATITVPYEAQEGTVTVVDASATALSNIAVWWNTTLPTDENQPSSSNVTFSAVGAAGSISVTVSDNGAEMVGGVYKILYILG